MCTVVQQVLLVRPRSGAIRSLLYIGRAFAFFFYGLRKTMVRANNLRSSWENFCRAAQEKSNECDEKLGEFDYFFRVRRHAGLSVVWLTSLVRDDNVNGA